MTSTPTRLDRPAMVRRALVELVAERGFRGTSMAAVAERAGVATGTAYVHYSSKDDLVMAAYSEIKTDLGEAAASGVDPADPPDQRFRDMWFAVYDHLAADPVRARFLAQVDASPYGRQAHEDSDLAAENQLTQMAAADDLAALLVALPAATLYDLSLGPAVRLVATGQELDAGELASVAAACWRAITKS